MKNILILYIIVINLIGFFIMGIDKLKAKRKRWRVPEKTLFLIALIGGSIGVLIGMYVFLHKTRHLKFAIGIPAVLVVQLLLISLLFSWHSKRMGSPSQAVQSELRLIQELDAQTIQSFVAYENLMNSHLASGSIDDETTEAVSLFFKNFKYSILNEQIDGDQAAVTVNITNIDMRALAQDLCTKILHESATVYPESTISTTSDYYQLLRDTLADNSYELVVTVARFHLQKDESGWMILSDETLEDELVGGFITCMNDPYILPASTVLAIHLDALKALNAEQWADYLSINDLFATYNTDYSQLIDEEYIRQLAGDFDYKILRCTENGNSASATVRITSIDMKSVLADYKEHLLSYAATTQSLRDNPVQFSNETSRLLLEALKRNDKASSTDVDITLNNNGAIWEISFTNKFTNALMGNMSEAIAAFNSATSEADSQIVMAPVD